MEVHKKELKHMRRGELLEMLLLQSREIDRLRAVIEDMKAEADSSDQPSKADMEKALKLYQEQTERCKALQEKADALQKALESKEILMANVGSIAEASLAINRVFEAAQSAADQYLQNVRRIAGAPEPVQDADGTALPAASEITTETTPSGVQEKDEKTQV